MPRVMVASPESPTTGFRSWAILDGLITNFARVFLKMISAELHKEIVERFDRIGRCSFLEGDDLVACLIRHIVSQTFDVFLVRESDPPLLSAPNYGNRNSHCRFSVK